MCASLVPGSSLAEIGDEGVQHFVQGIYFASEQPMDLWIGANDKVPVPKKMLYILQINRDVASDVFLGC